jgi:hypothetical protein
LCANRHIPLLLKDFGGFRHQGKVGRNQGLECRAIRVHRGGGFKGLSTVQYASEVVGMRSNLFNQALVAVDLVPLFLATLNSAVTQLCVKTKI